MSRFSQQAFREQFPLLNDSRSQHIVYFDNAATTQKPKSVINASVNYYQSCNANVHRASHQLSALATEKFELARLAAREFINAAHEKEIIWTKGTTESINLVAQSWGLNHFKAGDEILLSYAEHHANIVPWQEVAKRTGAVIKVLPLDESGKLVTETLNKYITEKTAFVACTLISNVVGKINDVQSIIEKAHQVNAKVLIDAAQAVAHHAIDVRALDCDFLVFSAHKMFGPSGVGVLYGKLDLLNEMSPYQLGGEMIKKVSFSGTTFNELPFKFEAGTPNIAGVLALHQAVDFVTEQRIAYAHYEQGLINYCYEQLTEIAEIRFIFNQKPDIPIFSFTLEGHHNQDVASYLDSKGIAVRTGHHCAMPLMEYLAIDGCLRVSLAPYNCVEEVDKLVEALKTFLVLETNLDKSEPSQEQSIIERFEKAKGWDGRHREIMLLGKSFPRMSKAHRMEENLIKGCESDVWLRAEQNEAGNWLFQADSDAKVVRGLLSIIFAVYNHKQADEILSFEVNDYFKKLGLIQHLSPSRGNGIQAIVQQIRKIVSAD